MKKSSLIILFLAVFLWSGQVMAVPVVDGNFGLAEWAGHYTDDDGVGASGYVGPGYGGQAYDVEYTGLYFDSSTLYFGLQTGFDLKNGTSAYKPGDFALDVTGNGIFDYAIDYSVTDSSVTYSLYKDVIWSTTTVGSWAGITFEMLFGTPVYSWTQSSAFKSGDFGNGGTSYVLEGSLDMSYFASYLGPEITMQWTMGCGNDVGQITSDPVPEPATMLLFGTGLVGIAAIGRKRKKFVG